jgi:hypothetical protein
VETAHELLFGQAGNIGTSGGVTTLAGVGVHHRIALERVAVLSEPFPIGKLTRFDISREVGSKYGDVNQDTGLGNKTTVCGTCYTRDMYGYLSFGA